MQLSAHFEALKKVYIACNYIDGSGAIDLASAFIEQNYDSLDRETGKKYKLQHIKALGRKTILTQKETVANTLHFNDEEQFYMNRIAFRLFKKHGPNLRFTKFVEDIKTLQMGPYQERLELWFNLMNEHEEKLKTDAELQRLT